MRIGFIDFLARDYRADSVDHLPMGGTESAVCYLTRALAKLGHSVFLINHVAEAGIFQGVGSLPLASTGLPELELDALVCISLAGKARGLRQKLSDKTRLILWNQHAPNQRDVQPLYDRSEQDAYDGFAMVSEWQRRECIETFRMDSRAACIEVLRNAVAPCFESLFSSSSPILSRKTSPPVLAYTSTPFRGLEPLINFFPRIRAAVPGVTLRVFSSLKVYGISPEQDESQFGHIYRKCRETPGIEYLGSVSHADLADHLQKASLLVYPCIFRETSCISVLEALAAGCQVITSDLAALPETCGGFGRLVSNPMDMKSYAPRFEEQAIQALRFADQQADALESRLRQQLDYIQENATWAGAAEKWIAWLSQLPVRPATNHQIRAPRKESHSISEDVTELNSAKKLHAASQLNDAEILYREFLGRNPDHLEAQYYLGILLVQSGKPIPARELLNRCLDLNPEYFEAAVNLSIACRLAGDFEGAFTAISRAMAINPASPDANFHLGIILEGIGRLDDAISAYLRAVTDRPSFQVARTHLQRAVESRDKSQRIK